MKKFYVLFTCVLMAGGFSAFSQYSRYIVQFKDKKGTPYTLSNPSAYLSAQAIARRNRYNISIDSTDLPITPAYVDSIASVPNVTFLNLSKWMNQVCIKTTDPAALAKINSFPFVKAASPVAARMTAEIAPVARKLEDMPTSPPRANGTTGILSNYYDYGTNFPQIHLHQGEYLHNLGFHGENMTIAVLDAGFNNYLYNPMFDSIRLNNQVLGTYDYVNLKTSVNGENSHGSWCLSTIAANKPGTMMGTCPKAKFWLLKTEDVYSESPIEEQNWAAAAEFADSSGADLISTSLGYGAFDDHSFDLVYAQRDGHTSLVTRAANMAVAKGMIVTASAGNEGNDANDFKYVSCPADGDNVFTIGATDVNGNIGSFSSYGPNYSGAIKPNVVSVGWNAVVSDVFGTPITGSGTSFSNPNLAGLVTCLWQAFPESPNREITDAIQKSAHKYNTPDGRYGYGIPNFKKAFSMLVTAKFQGNLSADGCAATLNWTGKDNNTFYYDVERKMDTDTGFTKIATVNGKTPGFQFNSYSYTDTVKGFYLGQVSYRIRESLATDTSLLLMTASHSITAPCFSPQNEFTVSPNPFRTVLYFNANTSYSIQNMGIELIDMRGNTVYQYKGSAPTGKFNLSIPASGLARGIYVLTVRDGKKILYRKKLLR